MSPELMSPDFLSPDFMDPELMSAGLIRMIDLTVHVLIPTKGV